MCNKVKGDLTFKSFSIANRIRCINGFKHNVTDWSTSDWFLATMGQLGEAANVVKKLNRIRDNIVGNKETHEGIDLEEAIRDTWNAKSDQIGYQETI